MTTQFFVMHASKHDAKVKLKDNTVECFSPKYLKNTYPQGGCKVLGEVTGGSKKDAIGTVQLQQKTCDVFSPGRHSGLLWRKAGYLQVGQDEYIALLKSRVPFLLLLAGLLALILLLLSLLVGGGQTGPVVIDPDHPLPPVDTNAHPIEDDDTEKADVAQGGGSVSMIYTLEAQVQLSTGDVVIYFKNPNASSHDVVVELILVSDGEEYPIARSGLVEPGFELFELDKLEGSAELTEGIYTGLYRLQCYDPVTGERALVSPEITGVNVTVNP